MSCNYNRLSPESCCQNPVRSCPVSTPFIFYKIDAETCIGLAGARFELCCNGSAVAFAISSNEGKVCLPSLYQGEYSLQEITAPPCYKPNHHCYKVEVDECCHIFVDGIPMRHFQIKNHRTSESFAHFTGIKNDALN